jgi:hypothetical protein
VTLAACADDQLGLVAVRCGDLPRLRGKRCRSLKSAEIILSAVALRVVAAVLAALRTKRLDRWLQHSAAIAPRLACPARERACFAPRRTPVRRVGAAVARGAGGGSGAGSPLLPGVTATAMPRGLAERRLPADYVLVTSGAGGRCSVRRTPSSGSCSGAVC